MIVPATSPGTNTPPAGGGETGGTGTKPGGGVLDDNVTSDRSAPRMVLRTRRARANADGVVKLRATCPQGEVRCRVTLRLRLHGRSIGTRTLALAGGETKRFRIQLRRSARRELASEGSLRVTAAATARDDAGNEATVRTAVRLLAPRGR